VEIEPAVLRAAPLLESLNRGVLRDPRVHVVLEDARTFLLTTREQFDVIISEPSNPWIAGVATLFTDEYYREARARLAPGGMFVQWVQAYSLFPDDFRMVLATLAPHFAKASLWRGESSDYVLVGLTEDRPLRLDRLHLAWELAAVRADLEQLGLRRPEGLLAFHRLDNTDLRRLLAGAPRNTDDHTRLEYNAPRALLATGIEDKNRSQVWQARSGMVPQDVKLENEYAALQAAAETLLELEELDDAEKFVDELVDAPETAPLLLLRGRLALARSLYTRAHDAFERALQLDPALLPALLGMGTVARKRFQLDSAELIFRQVLARQPRSADALEGLFHVARSRQRWTDAAEWRIRLIDVKGKAAAEDFKQLGEVNFQAGNLTAAEGNFRKLLALEAHSYSAHRNLGEIQTLRKDWEAARPLLEFVVRFNPDTEAKVYSLLATTYQQLGRAGDAAAIRAKGRRIFPGDSGLK
jgi:tetratricopeptide (TPR) repeat protein